MGNMDITVAQLAQNLQTTTTRETLKAFIELARILDKSILWVAWKDYSLGEWLFENKHLDADSRADYRESLEQLGFIEHKRGSGYASQIKKALEMVSWTYANFMCFEGERVDPDRFIANVPIRAMLEAMSVWNHCPDDFARAWVIHQLMRDEIVTPVQDMIFQQPPEAEQNEADEEPEAEAVAIKPKAVLKQLPNGKFTIRIVDIEGNGDISVIDIKSALADLVEWAR